MGSRGGSSVAMGTESTQRWTSLLESTPEANPQRKLGNLVHVSQCRADPGLWPLSPPWGGAVSRPAARGCNPARPSLLLAGECPLYARAIVILYWPRLSVGTANLLRALPASVHETAHADIHDHAQR